MSPAGSTTEGRLYLHGSGEPEESEGDPTDVTLFRADEHGTRFRSTAGLDLAREDREVLLAGDSVVLPDGTVVFPYLVRLGDPSVYESKTLAPARKWRRPNALLKVAVSTDGDGTFHPLWVDNRMCVPQMWTAPVDVTGEALRHGSRTLSTLDEVTRRTALRVRGGRYNDSTQIATLEMSLQNVSPDMLHAPMALRLIDLWSEFGDVQLADGRRPHETVLPVTPHLSGGTRPPDSSNTAFTVRARIEDLEALGPMPAPPGGKFLDTPLCRFFSHLNRVPRTTPPPRPPLSPRLS